MILQLSPTNEDLDLHKTYTSPGLESIYGAGCTDQPDVMLLFMNPTARNVSAVSSWEGIRAPWLGVRQTWKLLASLKLISETVVSEIYSLPPSAWNELLAERIYRHVAEQKLYITNLAKCTQPDARHLPDSVFKAYLPQTYTEISRIRPKKIITFGNQVSSVLLQKPISVSHYLTAEFEPLLIEGQKFKVYPTYYPVGQGQRNISKAVQRIQKILYS